MSRLDSRQIIFFEVIRRALGHVEVLSLEALRRLKEDGGISAAAYVAAVEEVADISERQWRSENPGEISSYPWRGVVPNQRDNEVSHVTLTGDTIVSIYGAHSGLLRGWVHLERRKPLKMHHLADVWVAAERGNLEEVINLLAGRGLPGEVINLLWETGLPPVSIMVDEPEDPRYRMGPDLERLASLLGKEVHELTLEDIVS